MAGSQFDQLVKTYVESILTDEGKADPARVSRMVQVLKKDLLSDEQDEEILQMRREVKAEKERYIQDAISEAEGHKKRIIKKAEKSLIYETIFVAFLVGMIVNQVTYLLPQSDLWAGGIVIVALLTCILLIRAETGKD